MDAYFRPFSKEVMPVALKQLAEESQQSWDGWLLIATTRSVSIDSRRWREIPHRLQESRL